jgi:hypothetical protein
MIWALGGDRVVRVIYLWGGAIELLLLKRSLQSNKASQERYLFLLLGIVKLQHIH